MMIKDIEKRRLALFDMDGVLYNSMPYHAKAWKESMAYYGLEMSEEEAYEYEGMRGVETIRLIAERQWKRTVSDEEAQKMYVKKSEAYAAYPTAEVIDGVQDFMRTLISKGIKVGVVTGSGQPSLLNRILNDFHGLVNPDIIVTAHDVKRGKPMPDPYLMGMSKGACTPEETIVVENAPLGVRAGKAADCFTIAVNTGPLKDDILLDAGADMVVKQFRELID